MILRRRFEFPTSGRLDRMQRDMAQLFDALLERSARGADDDPASGVFPPMNITQGWDRFTVRAELPGMKPEDLEVSAMQRKLTISGNRVLEPEGESASYHRRERAGGRFSRSINLPGEVDASRVDATYRNGILTIALPKAEEAKPRRVSVKTT